jgi:hypothetical protein
MDEAGGAVYARREGVVLREVAGEHILVPIRRDVADLKSIFALNGVGLGIWELLDGVRALDGVLAELVERFDVPSDEAAADLLAFVGRLEAAGLVERRS